LVHEFGELFVDTGFHIGVDFLLWLLLLGENIGKQGLEKQHIISDELGEVHISQSTHTEHLLVSGDIFSLGSTTGTEDGENISQTEIVMPLIGELLLAQTVE
jgi:hypothetical protein